MRQVRLEDTAPQFFWRASHRVGRTDDVPQRVKVERAAVGVGQRAARNASAKAARLKTTPQGAPTGRDVAQALAVGPLRERHRQKPVPTRKAARLAVALLTMDAATKLVRRNAIHPLREHRFAQRYQPPPLEIHGKNGQKHLWNSNHKRGDLAASSSIYAA
jgi:hypothetical protein